MKFLALLLGLLASPCIAAPTLVQSTGHVQWVAEGGTTDTLTFPGSVTAGNSVICGASPYQGLINMTVPTDGAAGSYVELADSDAPPVNGRAYVWAKHAHAGGITDVTLNGLPGGGLYGQAECWEFSGLAASPDDQTCADSLIGSAGDDAEGNCALSALAQVEELIVAVLANTDDTDSNNNITGPTGGTGCSWANLYRENDGATNSAGSADYCVTSGTSGATIQYSHDDLPNNSKDWAIAVATFKATAAAASAVVYEVINGD